MVFGSLTAIVGINMAMKPTKFKHALTALISLSSLCLAVYGIRAMADRPKQETLSRPSTSPTSGETVGAIRSKATLLLTYHRFGEALEVARLAQLLRPEDHLIYGALTDALVELRWYKEATKLWPSRTASGRRGLTFTPCDALAWCLFKKGKLSDAKEAIDEAMRLGTRDAQIYYHAEVIFNALGNRRNGVKHLKLALKINPTIDVLQADVAKRTINSE